MKDDTSYMMRTVDPELPIAQAKYRECAKTTALEYGEAYNTDAGWEATLLCMAEQGYFRAGRTVEWYRARGYNWPR